MVEKILSIKEAAALLKGERVVDANQVFRRLFALKDGESVGISELLFPVPEVPGRFEARRLKPVEPQLMLSGIYFPINDEEAAVVVWEKEGWIREERIAAMGKLAGEIAHEINNPLGGILMYSNLLKEDLPPDSSLHQVVDKIVKLATRCRIIAKALLNFGRPEEGERTEVNLNTLVREMFELVCDYRVLRHVKVHWELEEDLPPVNAVRTQLEQVVLNLVINAGEAMEGRGELYIRTGRCAEGVFLEVRDTGPGIPEHIKENIFEPFFTTKTGGKGTGLGLSICKSIVERHGGRIEVENATPSGAIFRVTLPVRDGNQG